MNFKTFDFLPQDAIGIRTAVFVEEQGFLNEFDDMDDDAIHVVAYDESNVPVATCRIIREKEGLFVLGRLSVIKRYRGKNIGAEMIQEAEKIVAANGGENIKLHAQCRVREFYRKLGYTEIGIEDEDEGCPHVWLQKFLHGSSPETAYTKWNIDKAEWIRPPVNYEILPDRITITTEPHTDLWQRTYYNFRNDNAPVLQMQTDEKYFSFVVKTDFSGSGHRFDQCGIVMYLDCDNWLKASVEYENDRFQHLGSVVTNNGYSDWATTEIEPSIKTMWYRLSRRGNDFLVECSEDGVIFHQMRICHMWKASDVIGFGIYACSPEDSSFKAVFSDMEITECKWQSHDGQPPDGVL